MTGQRTHPADRCAGLPPSALDLLQQAASALESRRLDQAEHALDQLARISAEQPEVLRLRGVLQVHKRQLRTAIATLECALGFWPDDALILTNLGSALADVGEMDRAIANLRRACELAPGTAAAWFNLGKLLDHQAWPEEALAPLQRAVALAPAYVPARIIYAGVLKTLGRIDEAAAQFRAVLAINPRIVRAWAGLLDLKTIELKENEVERVKALANDASLTDIERATMDFAYGQLLERRAEFDQAFRMLGTANATMHRLHPWNAGAFSQHVEAVIEAFDKPGERALDPIGNEVIFIVGLPRSGSTLVEQILASHPLVEGASELPDLSEVMAEESHQRGQPFPSWVPDTTTQDWHRMGRRYLERTARWRNRKPRFTDKMPDNWLLVGAALAMLPAARVIDCRREPLETLWSCYKQRFAPGRLLFTYNFGDLARYWRDYNRAMRDWQRIVPDRVHEQNYEALLANPEAQIRALLEFSGLPFDSRCLQFHEDDRSVRSLSAGQVRQPLRSDTARTGLYGSLLDPLRRALVDAD